MRPVRRAALLGFILAFTPCTFLPAFAQAEGPDPSATGAVTVSAPTPTGAAAAPALLWQDGRNGPTRVVIEGKASCIRVKWTGKRGPCAPDYVTDPAEELFFTELPQVTAWPVSAAGPKKRFPDLRVGDAVVKTMHADSECNRTFWVDGVVSAREECVSVRFSQGKDTAPHAATDLMPLPPDAARRPKLGFDEVGRVVKTHRGDVEDCLRANGVPYTSNWAVSLEWIISPAGETVRPRIENSLGGTNAATPALGECLLDRVSRWRFPESAEGMRVRNSMFNRSSPRWE